MFGTKTKITINQRDYYLSPFRTRQIIAFCEWASETLPNPCLEAAKLLDRLTPENQLIVAREARAEAGNPLTLDDPRIARLLQSPKGMRKVFALLLVENHPELTEEKAFDLFNEAELADLNASINQAMGRLPEKKSP